MRRRAIAAMITALWVVAALLVGPSATPARAAEDWTITSFRSDIAIQSDGALDVTETILVDFGAASHHGIVRDIPVVYDYDTTNNRLYDLTLGGVTDQSGRAYPTSISQDGGILSVQIGDPDITVSGRQSYVVHYRVAGALNGFADHDELYWNATGVWSVPVEQASATVTLPGAGLQRVACYEGAVGATEACRSATADQSATFQSARRLAAGEQLTVVVGFAKGIVTEPQPVLQPKPRGAASYVLVTPATVAGAALVALAVLVWLASTWWRFGRDRRYRTLHYLTDDPSEETRPLLSSDPVVIEYEPPEHLRPAEVGLLLDEHADALDATATIIDLAARGYLTIREVASANPISHLFGRKDWQLDRTDKDPSDLVPYESALYSGIFAKGESIRLAELRYTFSPVLHDAENKLYAESSAEKWFATRPDRARLRWFLIGLGIAVAGGAGAYALGLLLGAALVGVPVAAGGMLLMALAPWMPKRTAAGRELLRRIQGFRQYVTTAETSRQRYNERQNIFATYLPYAIVFHCVDKWARAFSAAEARAATQSWYVGSQTFAISAFARQMEGFTTHATATIASTPGGRGASGFGGGGAGFGGGGGGGHAW